MEILLDHQKQLVSIYSSLHRNTDPSLFMKSLQSLIVDLRKIIITSKTASVQKAHFDVLTLLFKLIVYSRDIYGGLGERHLSYYMMFIWKYHFPVPTATCFHKIVMPIGKNPPYGSWRDVKGFCDFIRKHSEKNDKDPFIETCIGLMNQQLEDDYKTWNDALDTYNRKFGTPWEVTYPIPADVGVSLVCRWIPRETSTHKWLFERCVIQWMRAFRPHYLKTVGDSSIRFQKSIKKGKKEYRHIFSHLSKEWDTLQIKQCSQQWDSINHHKLPMRAMTTQQQALLNIGLNGKVRAKTMHNKDRQVCASKIQACWLTYKSQHPVFLEMGFFIKQALRVSNDAEKSRMENLWTSVLNQIPAIPYMIPFLDMSLFHNDIESFYHALGMALAIACKSTLFGNQKRIVMYDSSCHFVSLDGNLSQMIDIVKPIYHEHHIGSDLENAFSMCASAIQDSKLDESHIEYLTFIVFGNFSQSTPIHNALSAFHSSDISTPSVLFWAGSHDGHNVVHLDVSSLDSSIDQSKNKESREYPCFVGYSNHTLTRIAQMSSDTWKHITPYGFIRYLLSHTRYDPIESYFKTLLGGGGK
jgi:hypothetical protein